MTRSTQQSTLALSRSMFVGGEGIGIHVEGLTKRYFAGRESKTVFDSLRIHVPPSSRVSIVGRSGCGKTTLLRIIGGLVAPDSGTVVLDWGGKLAQGRDISFVSQHPQLLPWLTVQENVGFPLEVRGVKRRDRHDVADSLLEEVKLRDVHRLFPHQLSGGMRQRAALARALITSPSLLLLDEPFASLDNLSREGLQEDLMGWWSTRKPTLITVTHSFDEAVFLGEEVLVLEGSPAHVVSSLPGFFAQNSDTAGANLTGARSTERFASLTRAVRRALEEHRR